MGRREAEGCEDMCFVRDDLAGSFELGMVSQGTLGVVVVVSWRFPGCWESKSQWVRGEEFDEVAYAWRWKGYSVFCKSRTIGKDVMSSFDI